MIASTLLLAAAATVAIPTNSALADPEPKTAEAVIAADLAWSAAEVRGDATYVDWLLVPAYKSVNPDGSAYEKAAIVRSARARADPAKSAERAAAVTAWRAAHPVRGDVSIIDDTAVLTWISTKPGAKEPISSCDIFVYRDGHWHGLYSQHSSAAT